MQLFIRHIKDYIYEIKSNAVYTTLCIIGTALTFIFVYILLHLSYVMDGKGTPFINQERKIVIGTIPIRGSNSMEGIMPQAILPFVQKIAGIEGYSQYNSQFVNAFTNNKLLSTTVGFVNEGYWTINKFDFIEGRPFTQEECGAKTPVIVISSSVAKKYYKGSSAIGQKIEFQKDIYTVIGVVKDFSNYFDDLSQSVWAPYTLNKFTTNQDARYDLVLLFPKGTAAADAKERTLRAVNSYFGEQNKQIDGSYKPTTLREAQKAKLDGSLLSKGIYYLIFLLLLIPAINLIALNSAFFKERENEVAIMRAIGATSRYIWLELTVKSLFTSFIGVLVGLTLIIPVTRLIENLLLSGGLGGDTTLFAQLDIHIILFGLIPLLIVFGLISAGIPAYFTAKKNISKILKGDIDD